VLSTTSPAAGGSPVGERPQRRTSIRLQQYDYGQLGAYFVTVCAHRRRSIFGQVDEGQVILTELGRLVSRLWRNIPRHHLDVQLDEFAVMPDHLHGLLVIEFDRRGTIYRAPTKEGFSRPVPGSIPTVLRTFKGAVTREWRRSIGNPSYRVWQRGYYEHIIRSEQELDSVRRYIRTNPIRWRLRSK